VRGWQLELPTAGKAVVGSNHIRGEWTDRDFLVLRLQFHSECIPEFLEVLGTGEPRRKAAGFVRPNITEGNRPQFAEERTKHGRDQ
jgi:hypothetical protein